MSACNSIRRQLHRPASRRRGLSLTELLVAATIMVMIVGSMSMLAMSVHSANDHCQGQTLAAQHGRAALEHIAHAVNGATASEDFPGCLVISTSEGIYEFPDTLFVWLPETAAVDPEGLPRVKELVMFTPDPAQLNCLMKIHLPGDNTIVPEISNTSAWRTLAAGLRTNQAAERTTLTSRLRTSAVVEQVGGTPTANLRGCVRFTRLMAPSEEEWEDYRDGVMAWDEISWPLDAYSSTAGARRVVCQTELQIVTADSETAAATAVPFFGSAGLTYDLSQ